MALEVAQALPSEEQEEQGWRQEQKDTPPPGEGVLGQPQREGPGMRTERSQALATAGRHSVCVGGRVSTSKGGGGHGVGRGPLDGS